VLAVLVAQLMKAQLFGVTPLNPRCWLVTLTLAGVHADCESDSAWRASRINPIVVLSR
jgi:hypothetical protein